VTVHDVPKPPAPAPTHLQPRRRRTWLAATAVVWAVLLLVLTYLSVGRDAPTVREQRSIADAVPVVHRALGEVIVAAGSDAVVELSPAKIEKGCQITPFLDGARLEQAVEVRGEAAGPELLDLIGQRLPASYQATTRERGDGTTVLHADAGEFVAVKGVSESDLVVMTASTGCRPMPSDSAPGTAPSPPQPLAEEPARVLTALTASAVEPGPGASVTCAGGGAVHTARATGRAVAAERGLGHALLPLAGPGAVVVVDQPDAYAYRSGKLNVVVEVVGDEIQVAATAVC